MADSLFSPKDFNNADLKAAAGEDFAAKVQIIENWQAAIVNGKVLSQKEEQLQANFLEKFFGDVLGYPYEKHLPEYMLENEPKTIADSTKPDGALGYFKLVDGEMEQDVRVVIELKGATVNLDKKQNRADFKGTPVEQAFGYVPKMGGNCKWVIVSNFLEIRLYHHSDITRYESFIILDLLKNGNLPKFLFLLQWGQLFKKQGSSPIDVIFEGRQQRQKTISYEFYQKYKEVRQHLFYDIRKHNPKTEPVTLFHATQKLIDRIIFVCFVKDMQIISDVLKNVRYISSNSLNQKDDRIWTELRYLFNALDKGYARQNIPPFNGGLFMTDNVLDTLDIRDNKLEDLIDFAMGYDFQSELNVNILGHIFEQSISDIEEIIASIQAEENLEGFENLRGLKTETTSKRKKDGIFYTPAYITRYIVEQSIGAWLEDRSHEILKDLGKESLTDPSPEDYQSIKIDKKGKQTYNDTIKWHLEYWHQYEKQLRSIKVLDPACGSGAFLTQALDYLFEEWKVLKLETKKLTTPWDTVLKNNQKEKTSPTMISDYGTVEEWHLKKQIIVENIFGVDINPASIEITRLSLWLKTANRTESLANLEENIRLGNSLIDDPEVAGDLAFDWKKEFKSIMDAEGFDVVVGNPPYVDIKGLSNEISKYFLNTTAYETAENRINLYSLFIERSLKLINRNAYLSFIVPNSLLLNSSFQKIREKLVVGLNGIVKLPDHVFEQADVETIIFSFRNGNRTNLCSVLIYDRHEKIELIDNSLAAMVDKTKWEENDSVSFSIHTDNLIELILKNCENNSKPLVEVADFSLGLTPYDKYKGHDEETIKNRAFHSETRIDKTYKPLIEGENIRRYYIDPDAKEYIKYGDWLGAPRQKRFFLKPRLIVRQIVSGNPARIYVGYTDDELYFSQIGFAIIPKQNSNYEKYLLTVLNSCLINFYHRYKFLDIEKELFQKILIANCKKIPIKDIDKESQLPFIQKADLMLSGYKELHELSKQFLELLRADFKLEKPSNKLHHWYELDWDSFKTEIKKAKPNVSLSGKTEENWNERFTRKKAEAQKLLQSLSDTDKEIDRMVYELYGLSEEEVRIVEGV